MTELPTVQEAGVPGYEAVQWFGIAAPRNTPADIVENLNKKINAALADAAIKARLAGLAVSGSPGSPTEFANLIAADTKKWAAVVHSANTSPQ